MDRRSRQVTSPRAHEIQPFGHLVRMPIALSEAACKESVENLNQEARAMARRAAESGDDGTNDLLVSDVIRRNELQAWFLAEHVIDVPLMHG